MHDEPIAFFITWTCYGTWLPGDDRGWSKWNKGDQLPQPSLATWCQDQMLEPLLSLDTAQREIVEDVVSDHCQIRGWKLHAVNCRSNHCHVVVTARNYDGDQVRDQLKSWGKRRLKDHQRTISGEKLQLREQWWTRNGSVRLLFDEESLEAAILYTLDGQDVGGSQACYRDEALKRSSPSTTIKTQSETDSTSL